ncbi:20975_t:CDS:2, partial [Gigaspora margarita]
LKKDKNPMFKSIKARIKLDVVLKEVVTEYNALIYKSNTRGIGTKDIKKEEDKKNKNGNRALNDLLKLAKVDYANRIKEPENC